jgi:predicted RNA-binding protein with PUA-like domain
MSDRGYWLMKSEESDYSISDLRRDGITPWTGVRNYEARNLMRDETSPGDLVLFYHSNAKPPGVAGIARVVSEPYPDATQFDEESIYYDAKASRAEPRWWLIDLEFVEAFPRMVALHELRDEPRLQEMDLFKRRRLSVQRVTEDQFDVVRELAATA